MKVTIQQTEKLFSGENQKFKSLGLSMLLTNLKSFRAVAPAKFTPEYCANEINTFLAKFQGTMDAADSAIIEKL